MNIIFIWTIIICVITVTIIINRNAKSYVYTLKASNREEYLVVGKVTFKGKEMSMYITKLEFQDYEFAQTIVKNYQYKATINNEVLFGFGYNTTNYNLINPISIKELMKKMVIDYSDNINISKEEIINNNVILEFNFIDTENNQISKSIELIILPEK